MTNAAAVATVATVRKSDEQIARENRNAAIRLSYGRKIGRDARAAKRAAIVAAAVAAKVAKGKVAARKRAINEFYTAKKAA